MATDRMQQYWQSYDDLAKKAEDAGLLDTALLIQAMKVQAQLTNANMINLGAKLDILIQKKP